MADEALYCKLIIGVPCSDQFTATAFRKPEKPRPIFLTDNIQSRTGEDFFVRYDLRSWRKFSNGKVSIAAELDVHISRPA